MMLRPRRRLRKAQAQYDEPDRPEAPERQNHDIPCGRPGGVWDEETGSSVHTPHPLDGVGGVDDPADAVPGPHCRGEHRRSPRPCRQGRALPRPGPAADRRAAGPARCLEARLIQIREGQGERLLHAGCFATQTRTDATQILDLSL